MTTSKEEVLRICKEAEIAIQMKSSNPFVIANLSELTKLIELVRKEAIATEREACLKICDDFNQLAVESRHRLSSAFECAEAIRGRE